MLSLFFCTRCGEKRRQCGIKPYQKIRLVNLTRSASCRALIYTADDKQTLRLRCLYDSIAWSVTHKKQYVNITEPKVLKQSHFCVKCVQWHVYWRWSQKLSFLELCKRRQRLKAKRMSLLTKSKANKIDTWIDCESRVVSRGHCGGGRLAIVPRGATDTPRAAASRALCHLPYRPWWPCPTYHNGFLIFLQLSETNRLFDMPDDF